ncbi:hypothetical protein [Arsenicicoccus bolidensis]|uniref:Uncharacterized protein n=1 Tax=Arsenicicoccus bolidensis TaxID=229480 RepID=A0ABS9Q0K6_9MICO|nr:hypothetical protein [Arsenicicoccus bolidensis]MCG7320892.1 hypothetical protein [Arsenicicoccus bolidensis]
MRELGREDLRRLVAADAESRRLAEHHELHQLASVTGAMADPVDAVSVDTGGADMGGADTGSAHSVGTGGAGRAGEPGLGALGGVQLGSPGGDASVQGPPHGRDVDLAGRDGDRHTAILSPRRPSRGGLRRGSGARISAGA